MAETEVKPDKETQNEADELVAPEEVIDSEPLLEPEGTPDPDPKKSTVHPLTPGGRRFELLCLA